MSLSTEEQEIVRYGQAQGKSREEIAKAVGSFRYKSNQQAPEEEKPKSAFDVIGGAAQKFTDFVGLKPATDVLGAVAAREGFGPQTREEGLNVSPVTDRQVVGATLQSTAAAATPALGASGSLPTMIGTGAAGGYAYDIGQDLAEGKSDEEAATPGLATAMGFLGPIGGPAAKGGGKLIKEGAEKVGKVVTSSPVVRGALQVGTEFAERVPRFVSRTRATIRDAATKAERIATAPAPVGNALKAGVDERIINTIEQADEPTRKGYNEIVRLAEESIDTTGTLKTTARPEIVAGEAAAGQYKIIDDQWKTVGKAIGERADKLKADGNVWSMKPAYQELDEVLQEIGVATDYGEDGVRLDFSKTGFTKAQRAKITELYELATEGGDNLNAAQIHGKDRLFSQLQRETRMDGIGDILVDTEGGKTSLFRIFRDVYSDTLEKIDPEIKPLNRQYRNLSTFLEDIEGTIFKSGKFETNSAVDPSEFAQTNLRRLFSEANSAADYRAIADEMDAASRALGYQGAKPEELARFAYEIRKIYPETTPRTGFEGSIKASVGGMIDTVMKAGKADLSDQQKALRELMRSFGE